MERVTNAAITILMLLALVGCIERASESILTPSATSIPTASSTPMANAIPLPTPRHTPIPAGAITAQFLIDQVGETYFREHYTLVTEQAVDANVVKASYSYTYDPFVADYPFTLLFDRSKQGLSDREVSVVLLEPQAFHLSSEEAIEIALAQGLEPSAQPYLIELTLGRVTRSRFAWVVTHPAPAAAKIYKVVLDVEGGDVYATDVFGVDESH
jgi:hypothetical protein